MNLSDTVAELVRRIRNAEHPDPKNWVELAEPTLVGYLSEPTRLVADLVDGDLVFHPRVAVLRGHEVSDWKPQVNVGEEGWLGHPAARIWTYRGRNPFLALDPWLLEDGALEAVLAADVHPDYARAAHHAGIRDTRLIIDGWTGDIDVEYLSAL